MQLVDPGPQREGARGSVHGQVACHLGGGGVDEDRPGLALTQVRVVEHHPGRVSGLRCRAHRADGLPSPGVARRGRDLLGQRQCGIARRGGQFIGIDELFDLRADCVQPTAEGGAEDERADEDAGVEVEAAQELAEQLVPRGRGWSCRFSGRDDTGVVMVKLSVKCARPP